MFILYVLFGLDFFNSALLLTTIAKFVILLNGSDMYMGCLWFTTSFIGLIWKPITGNFSERRSCKSILIWCLLPCIFGNIILSFASSPLILSVGQLLCAFGSPVQTLLKTVTTDLVSKENQAGIFNIIAAVSPLCFTLGAIVSGHVIEYDQGLKIIHLIMTTNLLISVGTIYAFIPDKEIKFKLKNSRYIGVLNILSNEFKKAFQNLKTICLSNRYLDVLIVKIATDFNHMILISNLGIRLRLAFQLSDKFISYLVIFMSVLAVVTNLIMAKVNEAYTGSKINGLIYSCFMILVSYVGLTITNTGEVFSAILTLMAVVKTVLDSLVYAELLSRLDESHKGLVFSSFDTVNSFSDLLAPLVSGILVKYIGAKMNYVFCSTVLIFTIGFVSRRKIRTRRK